MAHVQRLFYWRVRTLKFSVWVVYHPLVGEWLRTPTIFVVVDGEKGKHVPTHGIQRSVLPHNGTKAVPSNSGIFWLIRCGQIQVAELTAYMPQLSSFLPFEDDKNSIFAAMISSKYKMRAVPAPRNVLVEHWRVPCHGVVQNRSEVVDQCRVISCSQWHPQRLALEFDATYSVNDSSYVFWCAPL